MNTADLILLILLAAAAALILRHLLRRRKQGHRSCGSGCSACPMSGSCRRKDPDTFS